MSTTITATTSGAATSPVAIDGYQTDRRSQNIIHDLISGGIAVTLIAPRPRSGTLYLVYDNEADAAAALAMHEAEDTFTLERDDLSSVNMTYVIDGVISLAINATRSGWVLSVGYQEVIL